jgi:hypothetical protein
MIEAIQDKAIDQNTKNFCIPFNDDRVADEYPVKDVLHHQKRKEQQ